MTEVARKEPATSRAKWVFVGFILVAAYIGFTEHRAHLSGLLQYLPFFWYSLAR